MLSKSSIRLKILLVVGIVILANFLFSRFFFRLDFTADKQYTLSQASKNILKDLDEAVTVTAYFSDNLPPQIAKTKRDFEDMLVEYKNRSNGNVVYEFINPNESDETEQAAMQEGIQPRVITVRESDQMRQQRAYMGAKLQYGDQTEVIAAIDPNASMEFDLSSTIKKISAKNKPTIGFVTGHGEEIPSTMGQLVEQMEVLYKVEQASLSDSALTTKYKALMIIAPKDSFSMPDYTALDRFLKAPEKGLLISMNRVDANLQTAQGTGLPTGLEGWLSEKGVTVNEDFVIDARSGNITVQRQQGFFTVNQQVPFPYLPLISNFNDHPITKGLEQLILPFVSSISYNDIGKDYKFSPLMVSSENSGIEGVPVTFDVQKQLNGYDFMTSNLVIAATLEGDFGGSGAVNKMVVFGDGDFAVNGSGQRQQRLAADNINLMANAVDWLADDTGLNTLRTKQVTSRPIKKLTGDDEKTARQLVKFGNFLLPIGLIILYGFIRSRVRNNRRNRWERERYV